MAVNNVCIKEECKQCGDVKYILLDCGTCCECMGCAKDCCGKMK